MPGYPSELFLVRPPDLYSCTICHDILKSPKQCLQGHAYCNDCIHAHIATEETCPVCACSLTEATMANCLLLRDHIGRMLTRCPTTLQEQQLGLDSAPQENSGCKWTGPLDEQEDHLHLHCLFAEVGCPNDECGLLIQRSCLMQHDIICHHKLCQCHHCQQIVKRMDQEQHDNNCERKPVECPLNCGASTIRKDIEKHLTKVCPLQPIWCSNNGCDELKERRFLGDHDAECGHKFVPCPVCDGMVKRMDEEDHATNSCPKRPTACPEECGVIVPLDTISQHLLDQCPLQSVACPHLDTTGCSAVCPGRMCRRDLEAHLTDPVTLAALLCHLQLQALKTQQIITHLNQESETTRREYEKVIADLSQQADANRQEADSMKKHTLRLLKELYKISWINSPCPASEAIIDEQLSQQKTVEGEIWTTHHFAHEFPSSCFSDLSKPFRFESKKFQLSAVQKAHATLQKVEKESAVGLSLYLPGFRGAAEFTITAFRFGRGPPKQRSSKRICDGDYGWGWPKFFEETETTFGDWLDRDHTLPILVTVHLKRQE